MSDQSWIMVAIYLWGKELDPDTITGLAGVEPDDARKTGEKYGTPPKSATVKKGFWTYGIGPHEASLEAQLHGAADIIRRLPHIDEIPGCEKLAVDILVQIKTDDDGSGKFEVEVAPESLGNIVEKGAKIQITVYAGRD